MGFDIIIKSETKIFRSPPMYMEAILHPKGRFPVSKVDVMFLYRDVKVVGAHVHHTTQCWNVFHICDKLHLGKWHLDPCSFNWDAFSTDALPDDLYLFVDLLNLAELCTISCRRSG